MIFNEITTDRRPRRAIENQWDKSAGGGGDSFRSPIYVMGEINSGTASEGDVSSVDFADADEGVAWFGDGGFGAYMVRQLFRGGKLKVGVRGVACAEPGGGAAATQILTIAGNAGTNGVWKMNVAGAIVEWSVNASDTPTTSGDNLVAAFTALSPEEKPPCTPVNAAGVVTFTMANKGAIANTAPFYVITTGSEPTTQTCTANDVVFGGNTGLAGATAGTLYPTLTTPLAAIVSVHTPVLVHPWSETPDGSTSAQDLILAHMITKADGEHMLYGRVVTAWCITQATATTDQGNLDNDDAERYIVAHRPVNATAGNNSPGTWHVASACYMANLMGQRTDMSLPFTNAVLDYEIAPPDSSDILTNTELETGIDTGVSIIHYDSKKKQNVINKGVGLRLFSGVPFNVAIVDVIDYLRDEINTDLAYFEGFKLAPDGETNLDEMTTTPSGILDRIHDVIFGERFKGKLRNREALWAEAVAEINATNYNRVDFDVSAAVMDALEVIAGKIRQRSGFFIANQE